MSRSLRVRVECIDKVKLALKRNGFSRQIDLAEDIKISKNTVNKFFTGKAIDHLNFIEICTKVCLNWQEIADLRDLTESEVQEAETKTAQQTVSVPVEVNGDVEANLTDNDATERKETTAKRVILQQAIPNVPVWKGRDELLKKLQTKLETRFLEETGFLTPPTTPKVLAIIGQGGIGKTSLAVKLLEAVGVNLSTRSLATDSPYDCVMYFKAQEGTSFDDVAEFLLAGLGIETAEPLKTAEEKIGRIIAGLAESRCLLLLDNLETILHPANEANEEEEAGRMPTLRAHRAIAPDWGKLLNALVYQQHNSQTILTSREVPADLADCRYDGAEPDSELVHIETVSGVDVGAGVEILQQRQLRDNLSDLEWVSLRVEGHVFLLTQLAAIGKGKPGFLRKHPELVTKKAEPILTEQLARQSAAARDLLKRMCVLRVPIDVNGLTFLRLYTDDWEKDNRLMIAAELNKAVEFTEEEISETEAILERLVDSSLVQYRYDEEKCKLFYNLHQVISEFMQKQYDELPNLFKRVYSFYRSVKNVKIPKSMEDLQPFGEVALFTLNIGDEREQLDLMAAIMNYAIRFGHGNALENLLLQHPTVTENHNQAEALMAIGVFHRDVGNWDEAERCFQEALAIALEEGNNSNIAAAWGHLGKIEYKRGNWEEAERLYRQFLEIETQLGDRAGMASSWGLLGDIERNRGNWEEAERLYRQSLDLSTQIGDRVGMARSIGSLGEVELGRGNLDAAEHFLTDALERFQELGDIKYIAEATFRLAQVWQKRNNTELAQQHYNTAHQIFQQLGAAKDLERIEREWNKLNS
ncbi:MAG: tetratricopeptide repeat protein [Phormidium sp.]